VIASRKPKSLRGAVQVLLARMPLQVRPRTALFGVFRKSTRQMSDIGLRCPTSSFSSASVLRSTNPSSSKPGQPPPEPPKRWHSDLQARLGKCITFGCSAPQVPRVAAVCRALATEWRELVAGSEGFLTGGKRGLSDQKVVWGEMDSFVSASPWELFGRSWKREREKQDVSPWALELTVLD
jgi:hypothetical protein